MSQTRQPFLQKYYLKLTICKLGVNNALSAMLIYLGKFEGFYMYCIYKCEEEL